MEASSSGEKEHLHTSTEISLFALTKEGAKSDHSPDSDPSVNWDDCTSWLLIHSGIYMPHALLPLMSYADATLIVVQ